MPAVVVLSLRAVTVWVLVWGAAILVLDALWGLPGFGAGLAAAAVATGLAMWRHSRRDDAT